VSELSPEVRRFIADHIESAEQLEILLLLHRDPERQWTVADVSQAIYTVPASAIMRLERLVTVGFIASSGGPEPLYSYGPHSEEIRGQIEALAAEYARDRVSLIKFTFARPPDPLQSFADAFRLRGKQE